MTYRILSEKGSFCTCLPVRKKFNSLRKFCIAKLEINKKKFKFQVELKNKIKIKV